jgi:hypothetical protein
VSLAPSLGLRDRASFHSAMTITTTTESNAKA